MSKQTLEERLLEVIRDHLCDMAGQASMLEEHTDTATPIYNKVLDLIQGIDARLEGVNQ